jgi:hypothetical protein
MDGSGSGMIWYKNLKFSWWTGENHENLPGYPVAGPVFQPRTSSIRSRKIFPSNIETEIWCLDRFYVAQSAFCILKKFQGSGVRSVFNLSCITTASFRTAGMFQLLTDIQQFMFCLQMISYVCLDRFLNYRN